MPEIFKSAIAENDIIDIWEFIAEDSMAAADHMLARIDELLESLATNPRIGEIYRRSPHEVRRISLGSYVVYYEPVSDGILVHRILHGARRHDDLI